MDLRGLAVIGHVTPAVRMFLVERLAELAFHVFGRLSVAGLACILCHECSPCVRHFMCAASPTLHLQLCHGRTSRTTVLLTGTLALSGVPLAHARRVSGLVDVIHRYAERSRQLERRVTRGNRSPGPLAVMGDEHHGRRRDVRRRLDERLDSAPAVHERLEVIADRVAVHGHAGTVHPTLLQRHVAAPSPSPPAHPTTPTAVTANHVMRRLYRPVSLDGAQLCVDRDRTQVVSSPAPPCESCLLYTS